MAKRKQHAPEFKAKVAPKGEGWRDRGPGGAASARKRPCGETDAHPSAHAPDEVSR